MKGYILIFAITAAAVFTSCEGRTLNRCQIVQELRRQGFPENKMRDWVCLVENESSGRTHIVSPRNSNGSRDYGLFQINDNYWCSNTSTPGKDCNVTCADLITDDITKAAKCAKKIFARHGFDAWYGWKNHCRGSLPDISHC